MRGGAARGNKLYMVMAVLVLVERISIMSNSKICQVNAMAFAWQTNCFGEGPPARGGPHGQCKSAAEEHAYRSTEQACCSSASMEQAYVWRHSLGEVGMNCAGGSH